MVSSLNLTWRREREEEEVREGRREGRNKGEGRKEGRERRRETEREREEERHKKRRGGERWVPAMTIYGAHMKGSCPWPHPCPPHPCWEVWAGPSKGAILTVTPCGRPLVNAPLQTHEGLSLHFADGNWIFIWCVSVRDSWPEVPAMSIRHLLGFMRGTPWEPRYLAAILYPSGAPVQ